MGLKYRDGDGKPRPVPFQGIILSACCDACGQRRELTVSVSFGITVWACAECRKRRQWL